MSMKTVIAKWLAGRAVRQEREHHQQAAEVQQAILQELLRQGAKTVFGKDHGLARVHSHEQFVQAVPVRDYEGLKDYFDRVKLGEESVLWPGRPQYLAKTSGTTSGAKYIPITKASVPNHINGAKNALLHYIYKTGRAGFLDGKLIFLSGSPELEKVGGILTGRLSGIVNHHVPGYLRTNQLPSYQTNIIEDWETKLDHIIGETLNQDMTSHFGHPALGADVFR